MSKLLIKIIYVVVILSSVILGEIVSDNFMYIPKTIFWYESIVLILTAFISSEKLVKNWNYVTNFHFAWNLIYFILSAFFIAYKGWFILLTFFIPGHFIGLQQSINLNRIFKQKESTND